MAYNISIRNSDQTTFTVMSSADIIGRLDRNIPLQAAYIALVQNLEATGCRYSNQDFDVLSSAYRAIGKSEVASYAQGFVNHWAPLARA